MWVGGCHAEFCIFFLSLFLSEGGEYEWMSMSMSG